jgi:hypothetical protein
MTYRNSIEIASLITRHLAFARNGNENLEILPHEPIFNRRERRGRLAEDAETTN